LDVAATRVSPCWTAGWPASTSQGCAAWVSTQRRGIRSCPRDGQRLPDIVLIRGSSELRAYVHELGERAELVRGGGVAPEEVNMLKISTDGRKAVLDMRLITGQPAAGQCKLDVAAATIADVYHQHRDRVYSDPDTGQRSPTPGALQIVFCDLSTPSTPAGTPTRSSATSSPAMASPQTRLRFIHEARNDAEKARLFAACRAGQVAVIVGSTAKMGVGTNIQHRVIALHHLDCAPGDPPTSNSAKAARYARETRTPRSRSTGTPCKEASTPTAGRPLSAKPGSSTRSPAAASTSAKSTTPDSATESDVNDPTTTSAAPSLGPATRATPDPPRGR